MSLNHEQELAARRLSGRVLVTAGAGSGKTRMLTERFANAVVPGRLEGWVPVDPGSVVAITYTEKAAGEIAERVRGEIDRSCAASAANCDDLWISTIHGFCSRILRRNPFEAGIDPLFSVADTLEAGRLRERAFGDALKQLDSVDGRLRELLEAYRTDAVFAATLEVVRQLAVAGLDAASVRLELARTVSELLDEAESLFGDGLSTCDIDYHGSSKAPVEHSEQCGELLVECSAIASLDHSDRGTLERIMAMAQSYRPLKKLKGFDDLNEELTLRKDQLCGHAAAALAAAHAMTLRELVIEYADRYQRLKGQAGVLDFEDLQTKAVDLLVRRSEIADGYRERFRVVMIDEFQDTDALQLRLVEHVAGENLCTVGDEMQSIYGFRGADVEVYRRHRASMEEGGALVAELATNYRSHPGILAFVNLVFGSEEYSQNKTLPLKPAPEGRGAQPLDAVLGEQPRVEVLFVDSGGEGLATARVREAAEIADRLAELRRGGMAPGDVAVLLRAYADAHIYAEALSERGIPAVIIGGGRFFGLPETAVMRALTRVIANVQDEAALGVLLVSEFIPVADDALLRLRLEAQGRRPSLWELVCSGSEALDVADAQALGRLQEVVEAARSRVGREPLADVLLRAVEEAGYDLRLLGQGNMGRDAFANVLKFARRAAEFELRDGSGPAGFSAHLEAKERLNDLEAPDSAVDEGVSSVQIMSIHASKGLEFPIVVVPDIGRAGRRNGGIVRTERAPDELRVALKTPQNADDGESLPGSEWFTAFGKRATAAEDEGMERLFYVALTRARDLLLVSGSGNLNPVKRSTRNLDIVKLARVLGYDVPIGENRDEVLTGDSGQTCRVRVVDLADGPPGTPQKRVQESNAPPPAFGEPLAAPLARSWLPDSVSYTQFSEFDRCPRQFRVRRVLGITPPAPVASGRREPKRLGIALHAALRLITPEGAPPGEARMEALARYFELDAEEAARLAEAIASYCESDIARRAAGADIVMREAPLSVAIGRGLFVMAGSIDLYARSGDSALIVDYKSGTSGAHQELFDRYRLQADCYAFAALRDGCAHVEVVFVRPEVICDGQVEQVGFSFDAQDAGSIEVELVRRYRAIEESEFAPAPGAACAGCDVPRGLCEHRAVLGEAARAPRSG